MIELHTQCTQCGNIQGDPRVFSVDCNERLLMEQNQWCFECAYWQPHVDDPSNLLIVDNCAYVDCGKFSGDNTVKVPMLETSDQYILKNTGQCIKSNNLLYVGTIPERLRYTLMDNATFVSRDTYLLVRNSR